jgi:hypothetical protein
MNGAEEGGPTRPFFGRGEANLRRLPQRLMALEPREMTIDTVCAPNVKTETKQGGGEALLSAIGAVALGSLRQHAYQPVLSAKARIARRTRPASVSGHC